MNEVMLEVQKRDTGKKASKAIRNQGFIPGVFYVQGKDSVSIYAKPLDLRPIVYTAQTKIVALKVENSNSTEQCILKDIQFDPVTDQILHFDLQGLVKGQKLTVELPIKLVGQPVGVRQGGKLMQNIIKIKVKALPEDLVELIEVNASHLNMGDNLLLKEVNLGPLETELSPETVIAMVMKPRGAGK
ncbi:MAG TPA: 50S ribosomal protein L25 [Candidatus Kapabacteria bacterium]|nr:50S ribosomal protein L25 [Candidatus Kapabacteria bacterium]